MWASYRRAAAAMIKSFDSRADHDRYHDHDFESLMSKLNFCFEFCVYCLLSAVELLNVENCLLIMILAMLEGRLLCEC